jgi:hypothetical protein
MEYFEKAFGSEFEPHLDKDAAIKFILNSLLMDDEVNRLIELLDTTLQIGCLEGEPGWELERLEDKDRGLSGYSEWPSWAYYRASVEPDSFQLTYPEAFYNTKDFTSFVNQALAGYLNEHPEKQAEIEVLERLIAI